MQILSYELVEDIEGVLISLKNRHDALALKILKVTETVTKKKAKEYLLSGVLRRLNTIKRCIENIYFTFPLKRKNLLSEDERKDVEINLHSFFINIFGLLDNMAWVVMYEKDLANSIPKTAVGLYKNKTQQHFSGDFKEYLNSDRIKEWHNEYLKDFRDTLAHRIPAYVPPKQVTRDEAEKEGELWQEREEAFLEKNLDEVKRIDNKINNIGSPAPYYKHSISESKKTVFLYAQVITDFKTIEEITEKFCEMFEPSIG